MTSKVFPLLVCLGLWVCAINPSVAVSQGYPSSNCHSENVAPVNKLGWAHGTTVPYYIDPSITGDRRTAIATAFTNWSNSASQNGSGVTFTDQHPRHPATMNCCTCQTTTAVLQPCPRQGLGGNGIFILVRGYQPTSLRRPPQKRDKSIVMMASTTTAMGLPTVTMHRVATIASAGVHKLSGLRVGT